MRIVILLVAAGVALGGCARSTGCSPCINGLPLATTAGTPLVDAPIGTPAPGSTPTPSISVFGRGGAATITPNGGCITRWNGKFSVTSCY